MQEIFLVDPMLSEKGTYPPFGPKVGFPDAPRQDENNPMVSLPTSIDNIISDIDAVIVTHLHLDHWDDAAIELLPKDIKLFVQNEKDAIEIKKAGFQNIAILQEDTVFEDVQLIKTEGDRKSTRLNSSHVAISYAVFCLKKKKKKQSRVVII